MGQSTVYFDNEMSGVWFDDRLSCILHTSNVYCFEMRMSRDGRLGFYLFVAKGGDCISKLNRARKPKEFQSKLESLV